MEYRSKFSPKQAEILAAICKLQEKGGKEITHDKLHQKTKLEKDIISRHLSSIKDKDEILMQSINEERKHVVQLNPDTFVTTCLVARVLLEIEYRTRSDRLKREVFVKEIQESQIFKARCKVSGKDESYAGTIITWADQQKYIKNAPENQDYISALPRLKEEMNYLTRVARKKNPPYLK